METKTKTQMNESVGEQFLKNCFIRALDRSFSLSLRRSHILHHRFLSETLQYFNDDMKLKLGKIDLFRFVSHLLALNCSQ